MKIRNFVLEFEDEGVVIAAFGQAKLVKYLDSKCELRGGPDEESGCREGVDFDVLA